MSALPEPNPRVTFRVAHEDPHILVVEKPAGLVTTPGLGHGHDSLLNGLFARYGEALRNIGNARDFGMLQRLDRDASGLLVVALKPAAWDALRECFDDKTIRKYYWAITRRGPNQPTGVVRRPLEERLEASEDRWRSPGRSARDRSVKVARVSAQGKPAVTAYRTISANHSGAVLECRALTGRLHQVRAHLDSIGCSILGDRFYGPVGSRHAAPRLALHAHRLVFEHPDSGVTIDARSRCPGDMRRVARGLGLDVPGVFSADRASPDSGGDDGHERGGDPVGDEQPGGSE